MKTLSVRGRFLYAVIFIFAGLNHFGAASIGYAASQGVPMANVAVPLSGILAIAGGLSILLGYQTRIGALLLIVFLVPVTVMMHAFWRVADPMQQQMQMTMFMKNVALLGGALAFFVNGPGLAAMDTRDAVTEAGVVRPSIV